MNDIEKAMADFLAKNEVKQVAPILTAKESKEAAKASYQFFKSRQDDNSSYDATVHNAENKRYDDEGIWYVGGYQA